MRTWLALSMALMLAMLGSVACAPRQTKTHYDRWAEENEKRKEEEAGQGKAALETQKGTTKSTTPPPPASDYSSLPPGDTPNISGTSTKSRVIRPPPPADDGDAIY